MSSFLMFVLAAILALPPGADSGKCACPERAYRSSPVQHGPGRRQRTAAAARYG